MSEHSDAAHSKPSLEQRTFRTEDFYHRNSDRLTPCGLAFYQADWDSTLKGFFHDVSVICNVLIDLINYSVSGVLSRRFWK